MDTSLNTQKLAGKKSTTWEMITSLEDKSEPPYHSNPSSLGSDASVSRAIEDVRVAPGQVIPYKDEHGHLRDELWRTWLRVEYEMRRQWELSALAMEEDFGSLLRQARQEYLHLEITPRDKECGSQQVLAAYLRFSELVERRVEASLAAGVYLPLPHLGRAFRLTAQQYATLTFALMPEFDPGLLAAYRILSRDAGCRGLDARLLSYLVYDLPETRGDLSRDLSPVSPLIFYLLLEQENAPAADSLLYRRLRPAARLVQLVGGGVIDLDPQLSELATLTAAPTKQGFFPSEAIEQATAAIQNPDLVLILQGQRGLGKRLLLQTAAYLQGRRTLLLNSRRMVNLSPDATRTVIRRVLRECILLSAVPAVPEVDELPSLSNEQDALPEFVSMLCASHKGVIAVTVNGAKLPRIHDRPTVTVHLVTPNSATRKLLWQLHVPALSAADVSEIADRFEITGAVIATAAQAAQLSRQTPISSDVAQLDRAVRSQLHNGLARLGTRIESAYTFDHLVVDDDVWDTLWEIVARFRGYRRVRQTWGFKGSAGVSVLFSGEPGVGKTMSATVMAREIGMPIYEIDLSKVVSKWLGETEKNLAEVFDAAEAGHIVLLFNEADSLFGKRTTEVKSSNDRHANLETNYLLQRLEHYTGLAILTTNLTNAIDPAFRRRFAYNVHFSFPTVEMREELWRRAIPVKAQCEQLDLATLAERFELSGGFIKLAAERSAFVAAALDEPISSAVIQSTIVRMYRERGRLTTDGRLD